jgi:hypothetical protein
MYKKNQILFNYFITEKNIIFLELSWVIYLFVIQISMVPYPGIDPINPQGFFGWYDQGQYLKILNDFICCGLKKSIEWPYPFGYILLSTPINVLINNTQVSIIATNIILLIISYWLLRDHLKRHTKIIFILSFVFLTYSYDFIRYSFFVPWSTSATLIAFSICVYLHLKREVNLTSIFILGIVNSFLFFCRPQDAVLLLIFNFTYIIFNAERKNTLLKLALFTFASISPMLISKVILGSFLIGGSVYTSTQHSFLPFGVINKLIALFNGDIGYGIHSISILDYSYLLYFGFLFLLIYGFIFLPIYYAISLICYFGLYLSFSDFGPHNFIVYQIFHYLKLPLLVLFVIFVDRFNVNEYKKYLTIAFIVYIFTFLTISYKDNYIECRSLISNSEVLSNCVTNEKSDIIYLEGFIKKFPNVYFDESKLIINGDKLVIYKDYRTFSGSNGLIILIFEARVINDLKFSTINYSLKDELKIKFYKRLGILEW